MKQAKHSDTLMSIYQRLYSRYGDLKWWPAETTYEVLVGAILTQNTAWHNVEQAIARLAENLSPERIHQMPAEELQALIRPAGFYKQKSQYLKALTEWFMTYDCDVDRIRSLYWPDLRRELLNIRGVGNETADAILLYAFHFPTFVADAYTLRLCRRYPLDAGTSYMQVKQFIESRLPADAGLYNRFHALIVQNGKEHCRKTPDCPGCPLEDNCRKCLD